MAPRTHLLTLPLLLLLFTIYAAGCDVRPKASELLADAKASLAQNDHRTATIHLKSLLASQPDHLEARWLLGEVYLELGQYAAAEKEYSRARELGVADDSTIPRLAEALFRTGRIDDLLALTGNELSSRSTAELLAYQALGHLANGQVVEARRTLDQAMERAPESAHVQLAEVQYLISLGENEQAEAVLKKILAVGPNGRAWSLLGNIALSEGRLEDAEAALTRAIELQLDSPFDRLERGMVRVYLNRMEGARADLRALRQRKMQNPAVSYLDGLILFFSGNPERALEAFQKALAMNENHSPSTFFAATIHFELGNIELARSYAERFNTLSSSYVPGRTLLAKIYLRQNQSAEAERLLWPIVASGRPNPEALDLLSTALLQQGKDSAAVEVLSRLAAIDDRSVSTRLKLGIGLIGMGDVDSGFEELQSIVETQPDTDVAQHALIVNSLKLGRYDDAIRAASNYVLAAPETPEPYALLAIGHLGKNQPEAALEAFRAAKERAPGYPAANHYLAARLLAANDLAGARSLYHEVLNERPDHLRTLLLLAQLEALADDEAALERTLRRAVDSHPEDAASRIFLANLYLRRGDPNETERLLTPIDQPDAPAAVSLMLADAHLQQAKYFDAKRVAQRLTESNPGEPEGFLMLAKAHVGLGEEPAAERALRQALKIDPDFTKARFALAKLLLVNNKIEEARPHVARLESQSTMSPDISILSVDLAIATNELEQAEALLIQLNKDHPSTNHVQRLAALYRFTDNDDKALTIQREWVAQNPQDVRARLGLASTLAASGRHEDAVAEFRAVLEIDRDNVAALNDLAWHLRKEDPSTAIAYARKAAEFAPNSAPVLDTLALVLMHSGDIDGATATIQRAVRLAPNDPKYQFHAAKIFTATGDHDLAERTLEDLLAKNTEFADRVEAEALMRTLRSE